MFNLDQNTLEDIAATWKAEDIANLKRHIEKLHADKQLNMSEALFQLYMAAFDTIGQLKQNAQVYAFNIIDGWAELSGGVAEGIVLYLRKENRSERLLPLGDSLPSVEESVEELKERGINIIHTGPFPAEGNFLDIKQTDIDDGDTDGTKYTIKRDILYDSDIDLFEDAGIKVVVLDTLI